MEPASLVYILLIGYGFIGQAFPILVGIFLWPRANKVGALIGLAAGFVVTVLFSFVFVHPLGIHAGIWGLMINVPCFIVFSMLTKPTSKETLERFFDNGDKAEGTGTAGPAPANTTTPQPGVKGSQP